MKKITALSILLLLCHAGYCQLTGIKTIPGDYPTVAAAVADLNLQGVGAGGVTFHIATAYTENITAPITVTATGTASDPIVFMSWGAGANPLIKRTDAGTLATSAEGGAGDAIIRIEGTDYITFDGLDVTATSEGIEYGYLTHKPDGTNGCHHLTIKNAVITMKKGASAYVTGIYVGNGTVSLSSATGVTVTSWSGINSHITLTGNTIQNVHYGIKMLGGSAPAFYDSICTIGEPGAGNVIRNFGGNVYNLESYGIKMENVVNPSASFNQVLNAAGGGSSSRYSYVGIWLPAGSGILTCNNNTINACMKFEAYVFPLTTYIMTNSTCDSLYCQGNIFMSDTLTTRGQVTFIAALVDALKIVVSGNSTSGTIFKNSADGDFYCYKNGCGIPGHHEIYNNNFSNIQITGITKFYGIYSVYNNGAGVPHYVDIHDNTISNIAGIGSSGEHIGIYLQRITHAYIHNNNISTISGTGAVYGIQVSAPQLDTAYIYKNQIYNLWSITWDDQVIGIYLPTGAAYYTYNNYISDLRATTARSTGSWYSVVGLWLGGGFYNYAEYNTILLNATSTTTETFITAGILRGTSSPSYTDLRNNIVINLSTPGAGGGYAAAEVATGFNNPGNFSPGSNYNCYYAGTPATGHYILYNGTTGLQTIDDYKAYIAPMESSSIGELPPFINSATTPYNLHISTTTPTGCESGGTRVTTPVAVTNDYDGDLRWGEAGYAGGGTAPDIGADEFNGIPLPCTPPVPGNTLTTDTAVCTGTQVTLSMQNTLTGNYTYQWKSSPDNILFSNIPGATGSSLAFSPPASAYFTCQVTCNTNSAASNPIHVTVHPIIHDSISVTTFQNPVCQGTLVTLTASPVNPGATPLYQWKVNGILVGNSQLQYSYVPAPNDMVTCTMTPSVQCPSPAQAVSLPVTLTVNPILPVTVSLSALPAQVCQGASVTITATPGNPGTTPAYQWKLNGIPVGASLSTYTCTPSPGDTILVTLTSSALCTSGNPATSAPLPLNVTPGAPVTVSITATPNPACAGTTINCLATATNGGTSPGYSWKINGSDAGSNLPSFSCIPNNNDVIYCVLNSSRTGVSGNPATSNPVTISRVAPPAVTFTPCFDTITSTNAQPFKLKGGIPLGGTYSGPGVTNGYFYPNLAGTGTKTITYSYTNAALCSASKQLIISNYQLIINNCGQPLTDIRDGKSYATVQIGSQCWFAVNLDYGTGISETIAQRDNCIPEKYIRQSSLVTRQSFYQWDEIMRYDDTPGLQGLCPPGWHIPTEAEWNALFKFYINDAFAASPLKYSGYSGFNARLNGAGHLNRMWDFTAFATFFWSSTPLGTTKAWAHGMNENDPSVSRYPSLRANAFSVRCLMDQ